MRVNGNDPGNGVSSKGFSVAAIPIQVIASNATKVEEQMGEGSYKDEDGKIVPTWTAAWGAHYVITIVSDSGPDNQRDLDAVQVSEKIDPPSPFLILGTFEPATRGLEDTNGEQRFVPKKDLAGRVISENAAKALLPQIFKQVIDKFGTVTKTFLQYVVFTDARTGWTNQENPLLVNESGFQITVKRERVMIGGQPVYRVVVQRTAKANNGVQPGIISPADAQEVIAEI